MTVPLRLEAPAKVNLTLRVVGRREDGYHELESHVAQLELADHLLLMPGCSGLRLEGDGVDDLPLGEENLAWRGLVAGLDGQPDLACLALEKAVPAAAGLGGGSSDAAAAWRLGRAWRGLPDVAGADDLVALAAIGADVPFFATGVAEATLRGVGERVEPRPATPREVVLVHPGFGLSTARVFAELARDDWGRLENDLLAPARRLRPELDELFAMVSRAGAEPRLTGSGPTIFAITDDSERAAAVAESLRRSGLRTTRTRTRSQTPTIQPIEEDAPT